MTNDQRPMTNLGHSSLVVGQKSKVNNEQTFSNAPEQNYVPN